MPRVQTTLISRTIDSQALVFDSLAQAASLASLEIGQAVKGTDLIDGGFALVQSFANFASFKVDDLI